MLAGRKDQHCIELIAAAHMHRLNLEVDLPSLFDLYHVMCTAVLIG
jgi:hypothetical protein